jgi:hypothetical protein
MMLMCIAERVACGSLGGKEFDMFIAKRSFPIVLVFVSILFTSGCATIGSTAAPAEVYVDVFQYDDLNSYGDWSVHSRFGRVWRPHVHTTWRPFYYGHWVWSVHGWLWISYEPFGTVTSHHGYWHFDQILGWIWIPANRWYPATVVWMRFGDYLGWAPMAPPGVIIFDPWDRAPVMMWNFVRMHHFQNEYIGNFVIRTPLPKPVHRGDIVRIEPEVQVIEKITKTRIAPVPIERKRIEVERKTYQQMLVPRREADKIQRHAPEVKRNILKQPQAIKKPPVKKPQSNQE